VTHGDFASRKAGVSSVEKNAPEMKAVCRWIAFTTAEAARSNLSALVSPRHIANRKGESKKKPV
jgi:hypothetical protein